MTNDSLTQESGSRFPFILSWTGNSRSPPIHTHSWPKKKKDTLGGAEFPVKLINVFQANLGKRLQSRLLNKRVPNYFSTLFGSSQMHFLPIQVFSRISSEAWKSWNIRPFSLVRNTVGVPTECAETVPRSTLNCQSILAAKIYPIKASSGSNISHQVRLATKEVHRIFNSLSKRGMAAFLWTLGSQEPGRTSTNKFNKESKSAFERLVHNLVTWNFDQKFDLVDHITIYTFFFHKMSSLTCSLKHKNSRDVKCLVWKYLHLKFSSNIFFNLHWKLNIDWVWIE